MHVWDKQHSSVLRDSHKILLDQNTYFLCKLLEASTDKVTQSNWNKTNEMNISLASTTIFLHSKNELVISTIQIVVVVPYQVINSLSPIYMDLWIINSSTIELLTPAS